MCKIENCPLRQVTYHAALIESCNAVAKNHIAVQTLQMILPAMSGKKANCGSGDADDFAASVSGRWKARRLPARRRLPAAQVPRAAPQKKTACSLVDGEMRRVSAGQVGPREI